MLRKTVLQSILINNGFWFKMLHILCIVGPSGVGKTELIKKLLVELKRRGYRIAIVKHAPQGFDLDKPGKDSWRYTKAGVDTLVLSSPEKLALIKNVDHDPSLTEISKLLGEDFDIILAEGFRKSNRPKIEVHRKGFELPSAKGVIALVTDESLDINIPQFSLEDITGLSSFIEKKFLKKQSKERVSLFADGKHIPLNPFLKRLFLKTLEAMVSTLKGVEKPNSIDLSIRRKGNDL